MNIGVRNYDRIVAMPVIHLGWKWRAGGTRLEENTLDVRCALGNYITLEDTTGTTKQQKHEYRDGSKSERLPGEAREKCLKQKHQW